MATYDTFTDLIRNGDEIEHDIRVSYEYTPAEPASCFCPDTDATVEIESVQILSGKWPAPADISDELTPAQIETLKERIMEHEQENAADTEDRDFDARREFFSTRGC